MLGPDDFYMRWGTVGTASVGTVNGDGSYKYTVKYTRTLTRQDDGIEVTCRVTPPRGKADTISKTITVQCKLGILGSTHFACHNSYIYLSNSSRIGGFKRVY